MESHTLKRLTKLLQSSYQYKAVVQPVADSWYRENVSEAIVRIEPVLTRSIYVEIERLYMWLEHNSKSDSKTE